MPGFMVNVGASSRFFYVAGIGEGARLIRNSILMPAPVSARLNNNRMTGATILPDWVSEIAVICCPSTEMPTPVSIMPKAVMSQPTGLLQLKGLFSGSRVRVLRRAHNRQLIQPTRVQPRSRLISSIFRVLCGTRLSAMKVGKRYRRHTSKNTGKNAFV